MQPLVIETVVVPALLTRFHSADFKTLISTIRAFTKIGELASRSEVIQILIDMLKTSNFERNLIIACIRSFGESGEVVLVDLLSKVKDKKLKSAICFHLGTARPTFTKKSLKTQIIT